VFACLRVERTKEGGSVSFLCVYISHNEFLVETQLKRQLLKFIPLGETEMQNSFADILLWQSELQKLE
jgi:hypothetical protein